MTDFKVLDLLGEFLLLRTKELIWKEWWWRKSIRKVLLLTYSYLPKWHISMQTVQCMLKQC